MYGTNLMLRALTARDMTAAEQREASEQLGKVAAALMRGRRRLAGRAPVAAARRAGDSRRPAPLAGMTADVGQRQFERECAGAGGYALDRQSR
jgi:hypothetical protein